MKLIFSKGKLELSPFSIEGLFLLLYISILLIPSSIHFNDEKNRRRFHFDRVILR